VSRTHVAQALLLLAALGLTGCGSVDEPKVTVPAAPSLAVTVGLKTLRLSWSSVTGVDHYRLLASAGDGATFTTVDDNVGATSTHHTLDIGVHRLDWDHAHYALDACNSAGCARSAPADVRGRAGDAVGYLKASETARGAAFGSATAVSGDGHTVAVGAVGGGGAVYIFVHQGDGWWFQTRLRGDATEAGDYFGASLALSVDGNTLVVGAPYENGAARVINGQRPGQSRVNSGAAYVFVRVSDNWSQQAYLKASNADDLDSFGMSVAVAADGNTVAVGAPYEDSNATTINGDQTQNGATDAGAAYVFVRSGVNWGQQAYVKAPNKDPEDWFGYSVALSSNGNALAIGAPSEDGSDTGVGGNQMSDGARRAGAAYVFSRNGSTWSGPIYVKASNTGARDRFGWSVAVSGDGRTLAVGAPEEDGSSGGIGGDQNTDGRPHSGAVYVFAQSGASWAQTAYVKASNPDSADEFGWAVSLNEAGDALAVGARAESGNALVINGNGLDNTASQAGAAYVFKRSGGSWSQQAYVKASNTDAGDHFGSAVALSGDGDTLAVGAPGEASNTTGIGGNDVDNSLFGAGAAYLY
jgi:hypothetical protein